MQPPRRSVPLREGVTFVAFAVAYVVLFVAVPPIPLCLFGSCPLEPRPEAFLLAASLALGRGAVLGVATGGFSALLLYDALAGMEFGLVAAGVVFGTFLGACGVGRAVYVRRPGLRGALAGTWIVTGGVTLAVGTVGILAQGASPLAAYGHVLGQALLPLNVVGVAFLAWYGRPVEAGGARPPEERPGSSPGPPPTD